MLSESGVYALLVYHYVPGNRLLREWLTHQVVPALRDAEHLGHSDRPLLSLLDWPEMSLSLLHWQDESWIRLRDMAKARSCVSVVEAFDGVSDALVGSHARSVAIFCRNFRRQQ